MIDMSLMNYNMRVDCIRKPFHKSFCIPDGTMTIGGIGAIIIYPDKPGNWYRLICRLPLIYIDSKDIIHKSLDLNDPELCEICKEGYVGRMENEKESTENQR